MMKPITGQYECAHQSGIGLDYFTSRFDRLTIYPNGRFLLIEQEHSRLTNAAQSLMNGQQVSTAAPEVRREGNYIVQGMAISLRFDDGKQEQGQISPNGDGIQIGTNVFNKVSDSTMLPPTHRMKKDMDDIAKGLKIAGTIGSIAFKAAKTVHGTIQAVQSAGTSQPNPFLQQNAPGGPPQGQAPAQPAPQQPPQAPYAQYAAPPAQPSTSAYVPPASVRPSQPATSVGVPPVQPPPVQPVQPVQPAPAAQQPPAPAPSMPAAAPRSTETRFCDQCGAPARPGKSFCNQCGARLP